MPFLFLLAILALNGLAAVSAHAAPNAPLEAAKRSFEASRKNVSEVMFDVGYTDTKSFRDVFKRITGLTPVEYRNKYAK